MQPLQAVILGAIQGLTEFLPISSSGHLVIFQHLFGIKDPEVLFDISLHLGTLVAVVIFFSKEIRGILGAVFHFFVGIFKKERSLTAAAEDMDIKLALLIVIGTIPTGILGLLFHNIVDRLFSSVFLVGLMLILTGALLWVTTRTKHAGHMIERFSIKDALIIGLMQGIAIIPGISRSGSTIAMGLLLGLERETAARYSFLLSIPAIMGAGILEFKDASTHTSVPLLPIFIGALSACIVGYGALKLLVFMVKQGRLHIFAPYCFLAGAVALLMTSV